MNTQNVTLRQLRAFLAIADAGGFAAAARRLYLTPSALSLLVKELESSMKVRLFDRTTRTTTLSLAGSEFYPLARKVLDDLALALETTQDLEQKKRGTVRIACTPLYASTTLPELILRYRQRFPAVAVYVLDSLHEQALARVASGEADLGIAPQRPAPPELVLAPAHEVSLITTALGMVQWGHGITAQPARALPLLEPFGLVARPLTAPVVHRNLSLFYKRDHSLSPAAESFREFLAETLHDGAPRAGGGA
ncbi:MAG: LysR family transcriptional regulator [Haliea sp.]|nr:MAG: LysR family transcriptional regulator [Haliea sp.]